MTRMAFAKFMKRSIAQTLAVALLFSCGSVNQQFVADRVLDVCDSEWPLCASKVGCFVGERSYVAGRFPGQNRVAIKIFEPSKVTVSFLLSETSASGTQTVVNFYEERCRARIRTEIPGKTFVTESEQLGFVQRSAELTGEGDHLLEFESDAKTRYLVKVDVTPLRLLNTK